MKYDFVTAYRIYPGVSKVPAVFPKDKFKLAALCLDSFKRSFGGLKVKCHAILDGCPDEYCALFESIFGEHLEIIRLNKAGNAATFAKQMEILLSQNESENIYFAEDDYFYLDGAFEKMFGFFNGNADAHFVTPYDHPDYYKMEIHNRPEKIRFSGGLHFRTAASTCLTFLTTKTVLRQNLKFFQAYAEGCFDCSLWLALTNGRNTLRRFLGRGGLTPYEIMFVSQAVKKFPASVLSGGRCNLWAPMPSVGTHMERDFLAPGVDWESAFQKNSPQFSVPSFQAEN